ncbi:glycosyltransferase family 9 protein [Rahnella victoriana]|uniref:glycosyltransferase family 9 protein n=1 Tax=Rahnella victoriana TaxID=1510570 RepID=UPI000BB1BFD6|nr:glycosyltransferase family 9 protein [Rahnella victoriana]
MALQTLRKLNREKNILLKRVKLNAKLFLLDKRRHSGNSALPEKMNIIILCNGFGIGDAIVTTGLICALHRQGHSVSVLCEKRTAFIFENLPSVEKTLVFEGLSALRSGHCGHYDLLIDINEKNHLSPLRFRIIKKINPKVSMGINQTGYKIYDISVKYEEPLKHISCKHQKILEQLGVINDNYTYALSIPEQIESVTQKFIASLPAGKMVVINPYATESSRDMSAKQITEISEYIHHELGQTVVFIGTPSQLDRITTTTGIKFPSPSFLHAAALIKAADLVISPDTSIVHLCKVYDKKLICLYNNKVFGSGNENNIVWGPGYDNAIQLLSPAKRVEDITCTTLRDSVEKSALEMGWAI